MLVIEDPSEVRPPHLPDEEAEAKTWGMSCKDHTAKSLISDTGT